VWRARTPDEMKRLEELAEAAVGFDVKRGDRVVLENISFEGNAPAPKVTGLARASEEAQNLLRAQPELLRTLAAGLLAVLLVMFVLRPVAKQAMEMMSDQKALMAGGVELALPAGSAEPLALAEVSGQSLAELEQTSLRNSLAADNAGVLEKVARHIRESPMQSTRLLEAWIEDRGGKK